VAGGSQVPLWITITLGVLAVVGTIGGAWGGQLIAGRNDSRRWRRERDHEAHAFWRDRRLAAYATVLGHLETVLGAGWFYNTFLIGPEATEFSYSEADEHLRAASHEIDLIRLIGTDEAIRLCREACSTVGAMAWAMGKNHPAAEQDVRRAARLSEQYDEARDAVDALHRQFRRDLGVTMPAD
jgi:hypothetical protein